MNRERYRRGAHAVTDFQYHFVWKTKYGYRVLKEEIGLRLRDMCYRQLESFPFTSVEK